MIFRLEPIALCAAACEGIEHDDFWSALNADCRRVLSGDKNAELVYKRTRERGLLRVKNLIFAIAKIRGHFRQVDTADSLVLYLQVSVVKPHGVRRSFTVLAIYFNRKVRVPLRRRHILADGSCW